MFDNYISLGSACHVAASMEKLGIRSFSGPFDWYVSSFKGVLECLENDFKDFLCRDNLQILDNPTYFKDLKYDFTFSHEITTSLDDEYDLVCEKYKRRIENFKRRIQERTCFLRAISPNEVDYVKNNSAYIQNLIGGVFKKRNYLYCGKCAG